MARAAATVQSDFGAFSANPAFGERVPTPVADRDVLANGDFASAGEVHARALQAKLDRAFADELSVPGAERLTPLQSVAVICGASTLLWSVIGYVAFMSLK